MKKKTIFTLFLFLMAAGQSFSDEAEAIRERRIIQNNAIAMGDVEMAATFWTDDVTLRRGLGSAVSGKEAYKALIIADMNNTSLVYVRIPDLIDVSSDWPLAFESGTWKANRGNVDGPTVMCGRYAAQWVNREGFWFIRSEVFVALTCGEAGCEAQALP